MTGAAPVVQIGQGSIEGIWQDSVAVFRGIPYAMPPGGRRRFQPPAPPTGWSGRRSGSRHGPIPPQPPSRLRAAMGDFERPQDENCLSLTIATPAPDAKGRPVVVWFHGGAYMTGAGSLDWYAGEALARAGDLVVVGVNYRLGALGFLCRPGLSEGNAGVLDQQAALAWVAEHIADFGGDPARVTVMGQSAGGGSIASLLTWPAARPLFHRAILQSAALAPPIPAAEAARRADRLMALLDIDGGREDAAERLRAVPVARLLEAQGRLVRELAANDSLALPFAPTSAKAQSAPDFLAAVAAGSEGKEVLIGWTREEMHAFFAADPALATLDEAALAAKAAALTGDGGAIEEFRRRRPESSAMDLWADFVTEYRFVRPAKALAAAIAGRGGRLWSYRFDWAPPASKFRACHCIEIPFVFGNFPAWRGAAMLAGGDGEEMAKLSQAVQRAWIAFIRHGDPGDAALPSWPRQAGGSAATLVFDREIHLL